ncbi:GNAT family N-acetyltransferase [Dermabacteraceae bacterium P13101]
MSERFTVKSARLREIEPVVLYRLLALREEVFHGEQSITELDLDGRDLEEGTLLLWQEESANPGVPLSHIRLMTDGEQVRIGRLAVREDFRRHRLGGTLMRAALDAAGQHAPGRDVHIAAQAHLVKWYLGMGYVSVGEEFMEAGIPHVPMVYPAAR